MSLYEVIMSIKLFQLQLDQSIVNCGMSYVFRLSKNEFFIIDGGYFTPGEADSLFSFLKEQSEDEKPVISAWLFTHAHQDHIGCFMDFAAEHINDVEIKQLMFNFQPIDLSKASGNPRKKSNDIATVKEFYEILEKYCKDIPKIKVKTGERYSISGLELEVLYTADEILPKEVSFNDYSCVVKITAENQSILFLGDIQEEGSKWLLENKKNSLKSDIVQVAHHGFNGAAKELYEAINAKIALFPCPVDEFEKNKNGEVNSFIISNADECIVSGFTSAEISFFDDIKN